MEGYAGRQFVGMDLHRRRSVIVRMTAEGEVLENVQIVNDADRLIEVIARAGEARRLFWKRRTGGTGPSMRCKPPVR